MDYAKNYRDTLHSIKTEEKLLFDMTLVLNGCGSAGCMISHAIMACTPKGDARRILIGPGRHIDPYLEAAKLLNLSSDAAMLLFYNDVKEKNSPAIAGEILEQLAPIAEERQVQTQDVAKATKKALAS